MEQNTGVASVGPYIELDTHVAGVSFDGRQDILKELYGKRTLVELRREPENEKNSRAVAVYMEGHHVGYIPDDICDIVNDYLDNVDRIESTIEHGDWYYVVLKIRFRDEKEAI